MTNAEILATILSEASGKSLAAVQPLVNELAGSLGSRSRMNEHIPEREAQELLAALRGELSGIRAWLNEGDRLMRLEMESAKRH
jgi:hypothetical protein